MDPLEGGIFFSNKGYWHWASPRCESRQKLEKYGGGLISFLDPRQVIAWGK